MMHTWMYGCTTFILRGGRWFYVIAPGADAAYAYQWWWAYFVDATNPEYDDYLYDDSKRELLDWIALFGGGNSTTISFNEDNGID